MMMLNPHQSLKMNQNQTSCSYVVVVDELIEICLLKIVGLLCLAGAFAILEKILYNPQLEIAERRRNVRGEKLA